ncbi:hypothetical protein LB504_013116 [Fusarium proliferatum]|nr:hypothetical protein LB504_013116 [Fusarium proliferatum]
MVPSSILHKQRKEITAGSPSPINPGSQDDKLPEILTESRFDGITYGQLDAFNNISFAQGPKSDQEAATHPASCINPFGCHTQSPALEVPGATEEPPSPMRPSIDIIDLTLESETTPAETATPSTADADAEGLPVMPNVKVEKEDGYGCMETVEFIRHKSRNWKAEESTEEFILKLQEVVSFEMMVQGGSLGRINIHKSEDGNTYKGTELLMEYMVELSKDEVEKLLDDPEKPLGTRCRLLQEQNRSKAPQVA